MIKDYLESDSIAIENYEDVCTLARILLDNEYVVMISREEELFLISWVWSECAERNDVIFINRKGYEEKWHNFVLAYPELKMDDE